MGWRGWAGRVDAAAYLSLVVSIVNSIGPAPAYNVAIPLFAIVATYTRQGKQVLALIVALFLSIITDVIWALFNHGDLRSLLYFSLLCVGANILIKMFMLFQASQLFIDMGGTFSLTDPGVPIIEDGSRSGSFARGAGSFSSDYITAGATSAGQPRTSAASSPSQAYQSYQNSQERTEASL